MGREGEERRGEERREGEKKMYTHAHRQRNAERKKMPAKTKVSKHAHA